MLYRILVLVVALAPMSPWAQVNKCVIDGKTVYTEQLCPENSSRILELSSLNITSSLFGSDGPAEGNRARYNSNRWYDDNTGYKQALKLSASKKAPIFIYGYTDWCIYCNKLHQNILDDAEVQKTLSKFIKVKLNPEHSTRDNNLFKSWGGKGYPSLFVQSSNYGSPKLTKGPFSKQNGKWQLMSKKNFIAMLEARLSSYY